MRRSSGLCAGYGALREAQSAWLWWPAGRLVTWRCKSSTYVKEALTRGKGVEDVFVPEESRGKIWPGEQ